MIKQKYLKDSLEDCESAAEFLLDPWVLLQLPLQPMIAYQWGVALLAEALRFEKEIHQIALLACRKQLTVPIKYLFVMQFNLLTFAESQIKVVYRYSIQCRGVNYQSYLQTYKKDFLFNKYPDFLPTLEFVLSQKCRDVIKSMKSMALKNFANKSDWNDHHMHSSSKCILYPFGDFNSFWARKEKLDELLSLDKIVKNQDNFLKFGEQENPMKHLEKFVDETINHTGHLKEAEKQSIIAQILAVQDMLPDFGEFLSNAALTNKHTSALKTGIITNVITLQMEAAKAEIYSRWNKVLSFIFEPYREAIVKADNFQEPEYNIRKVSNIISKVLPDQKWCHFNIIKTVKASFDEKLMELPDFEQGAEKIAIHLQERIRRIVLKMIERHYDRLKEENFTQYPEIQFVQLILPCFVASFLDLDKDPSASEETKRKYFEFVHELVKSYERTEFPTKITTQKDAIPFASMVHFAFKDGYLQLRCKHFENLLSNMLCNSKICKNFVSKGVSSNFLVDTLGENAECFVKVQYWSNLVFMFHSRVRSVLRKMGFPDSTELILGDTDFFTISDKWGKTSLHHEWLLKTYEFVKHDFAKQSAQAKDGVNLIVHELSAPTEFIRDAFRISVSKLDGILLYYWVKNSDDRFQHYTPDYVQGPGFPLDPLASALWFYISKDNWRFKIKLADLFSLREGNEDPTLVPFDVAKSNLCYQAILKFISPEGKVDMNRPGEITFFPVKHCRWCGRVEVKEFRVCPVCAETPDYPDLNLFCSERCEKEALEKQHEEEHINFLMEQCGFNN